jgi:hypothetical protein
MAVTGKKWVDSYGKCTFTDIPDVYECLPSDVYELGYDAFRKEFVLDRLFHKFELPPKIYDLEKDLVPRVINTFTKHNKNFGILLKGLKGTGKTVTAKMISNELNLPVILVTKAFTDIGNFINSIKQDIILLFDEFEKTYDLGSRWVRNDNDENGENADNNVSSLLTLMDGVFTSTHKRLFILTTNKMWLPDAMISRPSRIRYVKTFSDLTLESINSILKDSVNNKKLIPGLITLIKRLEIITVDIVKAIAEEANLYNTADPDFFSIFNIKLLETYYTLYELSGKGSKQKEVIISEHVQQQQFALHREIYDDTGGYLGKVKKHDTDKKELVLQNLPDCDDSRKTKTIYYREQPTYHVAFL